MAGAISINIRSDLAKLSAQLDDFSKKQMPFATAQALTAVARLARDDVVGSLPQRFDRPTPFTQRGPAFTPARKENLRAVVYIKDIQADYLKLEETGGTRLPPKIALVIPAGIALNQYGNIPKGQLKRLKGKSDIFVGTVKMKSGKEIGGFWQRMPGHRLKLLVAFRPSAKYTTKFGYHATVANRVASSLPLLLRQALDRAIKTARR